MWCKGLWVVFLLSDDYLACGVWYHRIGVVWANGTVNSGILEFWKITVMTRLEFQIIVIGLRASIYPVRYHLCHCVMVSVGHDDKD